MSIGARIRQLRQHYGYSQEAFGELCGGVSKGMVSQWESDLSVPPIERLMKFSKKHYVNFNWLILNNEPNPYEPSPGQQVWECMQDMSKQNQYAMVKIGHSLAEPAENNGGDGGSEPGSKKASTQ